MLPRQIRFLWLISQLWACYSLNNFAGFVDSMLQLLTGLLEMCHLLLHLLSSLSLIMQLFFELLDATECLL